MHNRTASLLALLLVTSCSTYVEENDGVEVPRYGMRLSQCPASWSLDDVADSLDALIAAIPVDTLDEREAAFHALNRTDVACFDEAFAPLHACGNPDVHGGCVVWGGGSRTSIRLAVLDHDTGNVEPLCSSYLTVEAAKIAAVAAGRPVEVVAGKQSPEDPYDVDPAWAAAAWTCVEGEP